jgi:hypothetical protein
MRGYKTGYRETLALPIRTFWFMNSCINPLKAEDNLRDLDIARVAQAEQPQFLEFRSSMEQEMGLIVKDKPVPKLDRQGLSLLKNM